MPEEESAYSEAEAAEEAAERRRRYGHGRHRGNGGPAAKRALDRVAEEAEPREQLARERDEYLLALQRTQADFENYRKRIARLQEEQAARASGEPGGEAAAGARHARPGRGPSERVARRERGAARRCAPRRAMLMDILSKEGLERVDQAERSLRPVGARRRRALARVRLATAARPWWRRCCAPATAGRDRCSAPPWSACGGELTRGRTTRMVREGLLQGARRRVDGVRQGDHARLPEAGQAAPPRRQPGIRGALQGDQRGLRRAGRPREAQGVRRGPHARAHRRLRPARRRHVPHGGHG